MEELLTLREAAKKLRVAEVTLYRLARQGRIPAVKVGGGWRFEPGVLDAWLAHGGGRREARVLVVDDDPVLLDLVRGIVAGAGYVARSSVMHTRPLINYIKKALCHRGFSFIDVLSPCPTHYGRKEDRPSPPEILRDLMKRCITRQKAEDSPPETIEGKIIIGEFVS